MEREAWGRIIGITSFGAGRVFSEYGVIGVSKAAIEALIRYLAVELAPKGIVVNAVSPGIVETDALRFFPINVQQTLAKAAARTPSRRVTTPEDVARVVAFLCSDDAAMIVGQTIVVDGGWSILA
jgi:enoyl-[acyl-carrier protein] reductase III